MSPASNLSRRDFLKATAAATGALVLGFRIGAEAARADGPPTLFNPNAWLEIGTDGRVVIAVPWSELGQGPLTAIPMLLADELEVGFDAVEVRMANNDPRFGPMGTGGSRSVRMSWDPVRQAGAAARVMLVTAAALTWNVPPAECRARLGAVIHEPTDRRLPYGDLVTAAAALDVPAEVPLKPRDQRSIIGHDVPRKDTPHKVTGKTVFGLDVRLDGMVFATVLRPPVLGGKVGGFDPAPALAVTGVLQVMEIATGIAVVAADSWAAITGREALQATWDEGPHARLDSAAISRDMAAADPAAAAVMRNDGDADAAIAAAASRIEAVYELPFLSHSPMEPMNCTALVKDGTCTVWVPTQSVTWAEGVAAAAAGVPQKKVTIQPTFAGGGFGRRLMVDYVEEAVTIAKAVGRPVQMFMTREDDMRHGFYRPASRHTLRAGLGPHGRPLAWDHHLAAPSIGSQLNPNSVSYGRDETAVGGADNLPYRLDHVRVSYSMTNTPVPAGWLRSVYNTQNALANECFFDEMARAGSQDPVQLRLELLPAESRLRGTLERAQAQWGWPRRLRPGFGQGVACHSCFGSHVTMMASVALDSRRRPRVDEVLCVVDCGPVVHPDGVRAQMQGAVAFALSGLFHEEITVRDGRIQQGNFDDYQVLTMAEMPEITVVTIDSEDTIGGIGEPGYPPLGPAVLNALFDATGVRVRKLPLDRNFSG